MDIPPSTSPTDEYIALPCRCRCGNWQVRNRRTDELLVTFGSENPASALVLEIDAWQEQQRPRFSISAAIR